MNNFTVKAGWVFVWLTAFFSADIYAWYPESGSRLSGVGSYDSTRNVYLLIAFQDQDSCSSANLYVDVAISGPDQADSTGKRTAEFSIDSNPSWEILLQPKELSHWLPGTVALTGVISPQALRQLRFGNWLTVNSGNSKFSWNLKGSNQAILSAYDNCIE